MRASAATNESTIADELATILFALDTRSLPTAATTAHITRAIVEWAVARGWSVRNEARVNVAAAADRSQTGYVDIVIRRGRSASDVAIEIDSTDKAWSLVKLRHAVAAGMDAIWIRWGDEEWAGAHDDVDVIQLPVTRTAGARRKADIRPLWPDRVFR
jgi:hypothetical protein